MPEGDFGLKPGCRILVTGAGGGIGRALVDALLARGAEVLGLDLPRVLDASPLPDAVASFPCELTDEASVSATFRQIAARWPALDGLVALAGYALPRTSVHDLAKADWSDVLAGNLDTTMLPVRAALDLLRKGDAPAIVTMASGLGVKAAPGYGAYGVAKAGVIALTKMLAAEEAPVIRVNAVAPSAVDTPFLRGGTAHGAEGQPLRLEVDAYLRTIPLGRLATADEVVGPILFLLSPAARYITGQTLHINGGGLMP
jgi:3-oxoacyl-[acyl-carrier protein] reductase